MWRLQNARKHLAFSVVERERESLFARENTQHDKTVKILRAGCQKRHSPSYRSVSGGAVGPPDALRRKTQLPAGRVDSVHTA